MPKFYNIDLQQFKILLKFKLFGYDTLYAWFRYSYVHAYLQVGHIYK